MIELARALYVIAFVAEIYGGGRLLWSARKAAKALGAGSIIKLDTDGVPVLDLDADSGLAALEAITVPRHAAFLLIVGIVVGFAASMLSTWA